MICAALRRVTHAAAKPMPNSSSRGYALIGLLIFLALLGAGSAATLMVGSTLQQRSNEAELLFIGAQYVRALQSYYAATPLGQKPYPTQLTDLLRDPRYAGVRRHLRKIYVDPMTGKDDWVLLTAPTGGFLGVHSRSTLAPLKVALFDAPFAYLEDQKSYADWVFGITLQGVPGATSIPPPPAATPRP